MSCEQFGAMARNNCSIGPPVVNFTNILQAAFAPIFFCHKITNPKIREKLHQTLLYDKADRKMLVKLTPGMDWPFGP